MGRFPTLLAALLTTQLPQPSIPDASIPGNQTATTVSPAAPVLVGTDLSGAPVTIAPVRGLPFRGIVATFSCLQSGADASDFKAQIDWDEGGGFQDATITPLPQGFFGVRTEHTYQKLGTLLVRVKIWRDGHPENYVIVENHTQVTEPTLVVKPLNLEAIAGLSLSGVFATIDDSNPSTTAQELTADLIFPIEGAAVRFVDWSNDDAEPKAEGHTVIISRDQYDQYQIRMFDSAGNLRKTWSSGDPRSDKRESLLLGELYALFHLTQAPTPEEKPRVIATVKSLLGAKDLDSSTVMPVVQRTGGTESSPGHALFTVSRNHLFREVGDIPLRLVVKRAGNFAQTRTLDFNVHVYPNLLNRWVLLRPGTRLQQVGGHDGGMPVAVTAFQVLGNGVMPGTPTEPGKPWYWVASVDGRTGYVEPGDVLSDAEARAEVVARFAAQVPVAGSLTCDAGTFREHGLLQLVRGEFDAAIADFTEALRIDPHDAASYHGRAAAYFQQGQRLRAYGDYSEALRYQPDRIATWISRGLVNRDSTIPAERGWANRDLNRALQLEPGNLAAAAPRDAMKSDIEAERITSNQQQVVDQRIAALEFLHKSGMKFSGFTYAKSGELLLSSKLMLNSLDGSEEGEKKTPRKPQPFTPTPNATPAPAPPGRTQPNAGPAGAAAAPGGPAARVSPARSTPGALVSPLPGSNAHSTGRPAGTTGY